jgi:hypothetical protein
MLSIVRHNIKERKMKKEGRNEEERKGRKENK